MAATREPRPSELRLLILAQAPSRAVITSKDKTANHANLNKNEAAPLFPSFLKALTGVEPSKDIIEYAGYTSHPPLSITNKYYSANVHLWCDELPTLTASPDGATADGETYADWTTTMASDEAKEVREVIGGIVVLLHHTQTWTQTIEQRTKLINRYSEVIASVDRVRDLVEDETGRSLATVVVVQDMTPEASSSANGAANLQTLVEDLQNNCMSDHDVFGWEIVSWLPTTHFRDDTPFTNTPSAMDTNQYGEKLGVQRVLEVLEQADWQDTATSHNRDEYQLTSVDDFLDSDDDFSTIGHRPKMKPFGSQGDPVAQQSVELQHEITGLHFALQDQSYEAADAKSESGDELEVDQMMALMSRAAEIKAAGREMSKEDREKYARKEVQKLMREMKIS